MAAEYKSVTVPFANRGLVTKLGVSLLQLGQFPEMNNITSLVEGELVTRNGYHKLNTAAFVNSVKIGPTYAGTTLGFIHTLRRIVSGISGTGNYRYLGEGQDIYRIPLGTDPLLDTPIATLGLNFFGKKWNSLSYRKYTTGLPYEYAASQSLMLKDPLTDWWAQILGDMHKWGLDRPVVPAVAVVDGAGGLTGDYRYVYTFRNPYTGHESNPSMLMANAVPASGQAMTVTMRPITCAPQLPGDVSTDDWIDLQLWAPRSVVVYRSGGTFADAYYRLVGYADIPLNIRTGTVNTQTIAGTHEVDWVSGHYFTADGTIGGTLWPSGTVITISNVPYEIASVVSATHLHLTGTAGTQLAVPYSTIVASGICDTYRFGAGSNIYTVVRVSGARFSQTWRKGMVIDVRSHGGANRTNYIIDYVCSAETSGTVDTNGTAVVLAGGSAFDLRWPPGASITINGAPYTISYVSTVGALTLTGSAGVQAGVPYSVPDMLIVRTDAGIHSNYMWNVIVAEDRDITFVDNTSDLEIASARTAEFDNDPPVTASLSIPFHATIAQWLGGYMGPAPWWVEAELDIEQGFGPGTIAISEVLRPGTVLNLGWVEALGTGRYEQVVLWAITGNRSVKFWMQETHDPGDPIIGSSVANTPCDTVAHAHNSLFLAGDRINPNMLYKSKAGRPEAFPIVNLADGSPGSVEVGTPEDYNQAIVEFNGEVVCLNKCGIYVVPLWGGAMQKPQRTPARRGLFGKHAWCKGDNEIWYLAYDGIYSWGGGDCTKRSEAIDPIFRGETVNGIVPMNMSDILPGGEILTPLERIHFAYHRNQLIVSYRATDNTTHRLIFQTLYDRWLPMNVETTAVNVEEDVGTLLMATSSGGAAYIHEDDTPVTPAIAFTTDGWTATQDDGAAIAWSVKTPFYDLGAAALQKQWGDVVLELENPQAGGPAVNVAVQTYYDYSATPDGTDSFTIPQVAGRRRVPLPLQSGKAKEAGAVAFKFSGTGTKVPIKFYSLTFHYLPLEEIQRGRASDWNDLGWPHDKRLFQLMIEYDTGGAAVTMNLDGLTGVAGATVSSTLATFTLQSAAPGSDGPTRAKATLPMPDNVVVKAVRFRPTVAATDFKIWVADCRKEDYPPDIVPFTEYNSYGTPFDKYFQQLLLDVDTNGQDVPITIEGDGANKQTVTVNSTWQTRDVRLTLNPSITARKVRLVTGAVPAGAKFQLFSHDFVHLPADRGPVHHTHDWDTLEWPHDKHLKRIVIEYDTENTPTTVVMDTITGVDGITTNLAVQSFVLTGTSRSIQNFQINDGTIVKMVRIRPTTTNTVFKQWGYRVEKVDYPPDKLAATEWWDGGNPYEKYFQQVILDIDTGGYDVPFTVEGDHANKQTITVNSSGQNAKVFTLNPQIMARKVRIKCGTVPAGGKFQLFNHDFVWLPADKGPVTHSFDWDDLGHPFDKHLKRITFEYDTAGSNTIMLMDTMSGIEGTTIRTAQYPDGTAASFTLNGTSRSKQQFIIPDGTIVKMIRIYPQADNTVFKVWKYWCDFEKYPPDKCPGTEWDDFGYPHEKIVRELVLDVDTGGVNASVSIEADGMRYQTFSEVRTTRLDRNRTLTLDSDIIGRHFRIMPVAGTDGKFQLWKHKFNWIPEPPAVTSWDSYEQAFEYDGFKFIKQIWVEYWSPVTLTMYVYTDNYQLLHSVTLPRHPKRAMERFYLPVKSSAGVLNKSKIYRFVIKCCDVCAEFKLYRDGTRVEVMNLSGDQREAYTQQHLWEPMPIPAM